MNAIALLDLTLREILVDIPHDFGALVAYTILVLFVLGIWYGSRGQAPGPDRSSESGTR